LVRPGKEDTAIRVDLFACEWTEGSVTNVTGADIYSTLEGQMEYIQVRNYFDAVDFGKPWDSRCRIMKKIVEYLRDPKPLEQKAASWSSDSIKWPLNDRHSCLVDCNVPQVCLFDGVCRCVETDSVCPSKRPRPPISVFKVDDPVKAAAKLTASDIMLEQFFWKAMSQEKYNTLPPLTLTADHEWDYISSLKQTYPGHVEQFLSMKAIPESVHKIGEHKSIGSKSPLDMVLMPFAHGIVSHSFSI